jgi:hypothetical protein
VAAWPGRDGRRCPRPDRRTGRVRLGRSAALDSRPGRRLDLHRLRTGRLGSAAREPYWPADGGDRLHLVLWQLRRCRCGGGGLGGGARGVPVSRAPDAPGTGLPVRAARVATDPRSRRGRLRRGGHHAGLAESGRHHRAGWAAGGCLRPRLCRGGRPKPTGALDCTAGRRRARPAARGNRGGSAAAAAGRCQRSVAACV